MSERPTDVALRLLDRAADPVYWFDHAGRNVYANAAACRALGYAPEEMLKLSVFDYDSAFEKDRWEETLRRISTGDLARYRSEHRCRDGARVPVDISLSVAEVCGEGVICAFARSAAAASGQDLVRLKAALEHAEDAWFLHDIHGRITFVNRSACRSLGYSEAELLSMDVSAIDPSVRREDIERYHAKYSAAGPRLIEGCHRRKDGTTFPIEAGVSIQRLDGETCFCTMARDISERKAKETQLEQLRFAIDNAVDAVFLTTRDGDIFYANRSATESLGYGIEELTRMNVADIDPTLTAERRAQFAEQEQVAGRHTAETLHRRKDGTTFPVELAFNFRSFRGEDYSCAFARDVSERKKTERQMQELQFAVENAVDAVYLNDGDGHIYYANPSACRMLGYTREEITRLNIADIDPLFDPGVLREIVERGGEQAAPPPAGVWHMRKDGSRVPVEVTFNSRSVGGSRYFCSFVRDISERKEAEKEKEQLMYIINNATDAIYIYDYEGWIRYANASAGAQLGYRIEELLTMNIRDLDPAFPHEERREGNWEEARSGRRVVFETVHRRKNGEEIPVEIAQSVTSFAGAEYASAFVRDITDRRRAEREREQLVYILNNATDAVCIYDHDGRILYANARAIEQYGYTREELLTMTVRDLDPFIPDDEYRRRNWERARRGERLVFEARHRRKDGSLFPVEISYGVTRVDGTEFASAYIRDVSERKAAERQREQLMFIIDNAKDAVYMYGPDRRVTYANKSASVQTGYRRDELIGMDIGDLDPDFPLERREEMWARARAGDLISLETRHRRKDGSLFPVEISPAITTFDGATYSGVFVRDITQRKDAERKRRELEFAINNASDAVYIYDRDRKFHYVNDGAVQQTGYSREELLGMCVDDIDRFLPAAEKERRWTESEGRRRTIMQSRHTRKDGTDFPVEISHGATVFEGRLFASAVVRDISERKQVERQLQLMHAAIEGSRTSFFAISPLGRIEYANEYAWKSLGWEREDVVGGYVWDIDPGFDAEQQTAFWTSISQAGVLRFERTHRRRDGTTIPVEITANYFSFAGEEFALAFVQDLTERKRMEWQRELLQFVIENASDAVYIYDYDGRLTYANASASAATGYSRQELTAMTVRQLDRHYPPQETWDRNWRQALAGERFAIESWHTRKDGSEYPVEITVNVSVFGGVEYGCAFVRDVTDRKRATQQMEVLRFAIDNAVVPIYFYNDRAELTYGNKSACRALGYSLEELTKLTIADVDPNLPQEQWVRVYTAVKEGRQAGGWESTNRRKDGTTFPVQVNPTNMKFGDMEFGCSVNLDISERKKTEALLAEYREHLEDLVRNRTAELEAAQQELVRTERLAVLGRLTGMVGHELRNPLGTIRASLFFIRKKVDDVEPLVERAFDRAERNVVRCDKIIDELLSYTRTRPLHLERVMLDTWLKDVLDDYELPQDVALETDIAAGLAVNIEPDRFRQCLVNALANACEAMLENPAGRPKKLRIVARAVAGGVEVAVEDTGPGIPEDRMQKIFEPLYSTKGFGFGLGLPIVEQIAKQHGGSVSVASRVGEGTRLSLSLPAH